MQFSEKLWKTRENIDIKLVTAEIRRNCLVSEPNYYITKFLTEHLLATGMKKKQPEILMNKPVYLGF